MAVALLAGLGLYGLSSALQGDRTGESGRDPCYGRTSEDCRELIEQSNAEFFTKLREWSQAIPTDEEYLRSLPQTHEVMASGPPPPASLAEVLAAADVVIVARSETVSFGGDRGTEVRLAVGKYIVGSGPDELTIHQASGPMPDLDDWEPHLVMWPSDPLLIPGDRAVLFLRDEPSFGYVPIPYAGQYRLDDSDTVSPLAANAFATSIRGLDLEAFTALIEAIVEQSDLPPSDSSP